MSQPSQIVTFFLTSPEARAWLVIKGHLEESRVIEMCNSYANHWSVSAWLVPGEYLCRYYCGDDRHVDYHGPAQINGVVDGGMDGLVSVKIERDRATFRIINILLVEDNSTILTAFARLLRSHGYSVSAAEGYQTALALAKQVRFDLAICDINLWDGDGCDLLTELQKLQPMKAIAVTGYTLPEETEHYLDAGFAVVLQKPTRYSELASAISLVSSTLPISTSILQTVAN